MKQPRLFRVSVWQRLRAVNLASLIPFIALAISAASFYRTGIYERQSLTLRFLELYPEPDPGAESPYGFRGRVALINTGTTDVMVIAAEASVSRTGNPPVKVDPTDGVVEMEPTIVPPKQIRVVRLQILGLTRTAGVLTAVTEAEYHMTFHSVDSRSVLYQRGFLVGYWTPRRAAYVNEVRRIGNSRRIELLESMYTGDLFGLKGLVK